MNDEPEKEARSGWTDFLIDVFFILLISACLYPFACRVFWIYHSTLMNIIGIIVVLTISSVVYYLLKKRDSNYRR